MKLDLSRAWRARIDVDAQWQGRTTYKKAITLTVLAESLPDAVSLVQADYPGCTIWSINHVGADAVVLVGDLSKLTTPSESNTP